MNARECFDCESGCDRLVDCIYTFTCYEINIHSFVRCQCITHLNAHQPSTVLIVHNKEQQPCHILNLSTLWETTNCLVTDWFSNNKHLSLCIECEEKEKKIIKKSFSLFHNWKYYYFEKLNTQSRIHSVIIKLWIDAKYQNKKKIWRRQINKFQVICVYFRGKILIESFLFLLFFLNTEIDRVIYLRARLSSHL